jgi:hypothetical protein
MLVQKIEMVYESSDERARSIPDFFGRDVQFIVKFHSVALSRNGAIGRYQ